MARVIAQRAQLLGAITHFQMEAKLAVQYAGKGYTARMEWTHTPTHDQLRIFSPLGAQVALIERSPSLVQLTDQQGKVHHAADIEQLTENLLGWRLPMAGLSRWVLGTAHPLSAFRAEYLADGHVQQLTQDGWQIDYRAYDTAQLAARDNVAAITVALPQQLQLAQNDIRLKLVIQRWQ